ncbi:MAG: diacylglycerol kinase [Burkholderiaceae bacterium]
MNAKQHGWKRIISAGGNSVRGLRAAWHEPAFRQELYFVVVLLPWTPFLARSWLEGVALVSLLALVLITELLNTGIESVVDRVGLQWNELSGRAKDVASSAVFISLVLCGGVWFSAFVRWLWP